MASYYGEDRKHLPGSVLVEPETKKKFGKAAREDALKGMLVFYKQQKEAAENKIEQAVETKPSGEKVID